MKPKKTFTKSLNKVTLFLHTRKNVIVNKENDLINTRFKETNHIVHVVIERETEVIRFIVFSILTEVNNIKGEYSRHIRNYYKEEKDIAKLIGDVITVPPTVTDIESYIIEELRLILPYYINRHLL